MKTTFPAFVLSFALAATLHAGPRTSANYSITSDGFDDGGMHTSSAAYTNDSSTGGFASPVTAGADTATARSGFLGQLYEVIGIAVTGATAAVQQGAPLQLDAWQSLDDGTLLAAPESLAVQWFLNGVAIAGATGPGYTLSSVQLSQAGAYSVRITGSDGSVFTSTPVTLVVTGFPARLLNLSTRAQCLTGDNLLIPGFVLGGSGSKRVLIRGVGPTLGSFGVSDTLADPQMNLVNSTGSVIASNDDWGSNANKAAIIATAATVGAFPLVDGSKDAVLLLDLAPGAYTVPTSGVAGGTGVAIVELYDADAGTPTATLVNISNRGFVGVGDNVMIPGIVVSNEGPRTFLLRAVGPTLGGFGVSGTLTDPVLTVFSGSTAILTNDDWGNGTPDTANVAATVGAFPLSPGSKDAAFVVTLQPGAYTIQATGKEATTGVALVEVYLVP